MHWVDVLGRCVLEMSGRTRTSVQKKNVVLVDISQFY